MNRTTVFALIAALLTISCSAVSQTPEETPEPAQQPTHDSGDSPAEATDPDVMYGVLAGEVLGAEGLTGKSAYEYLEAALESDDPAIAARATRVALSAQEWQLAAMAADRWAVLAPENIDARQTAAQTMIAVGDYFGAEHQLGQLLEVMSADRSRAWSMVAEILSTNANPEKIQLVLSNLVQDTKSEKDADALFAASIVAGRQGNLPASLSLADEALSADPERADVHAWAGRLAVNLDQQDKALGHYKAAWELRSSDLRIVMAYAELLRRNGESDQAQEILETLDDTPATRFTRIAFALDSGHDELARRLYDGFEGHSYADPREAAFQAAQAAELLSLPNQARRWYGQVKSGQRLLVATLRRAYLAADAGELQQARSMLAELRDGHGEDFRNESLIAEGEILVNAGEVEESLELLSQAIDENEPDTRLLYSKAMLLVQLERLDEAEKELLTIIQAEPDNATALNALGYTLTDRTDRHEEAEQLIRAAYELSPDESSIIDSMGWVAYRLGRLEEAEHYLRDAWTRDRNAEIGAHLGEVLWAGERTEEARAIWKEAMQVDPNNVVLNETLERYGVEL